MKPGLSHPRRVPFNKGWRDAALEFTPWLTEQRNLDRLAYTLGINELKLVQDEYPAHAFKLGILCFDDVGLFIIVNQLHKTDDRYLGQIITSSARVGAMRVIWIAKSFRPEHLATFEFLNRNTTDDLKFFAVEIELWRIADLPVTRLFNVACKPTNWAMVD